MAVRYIIFAFTLVLNANVMLSTFQNEEEEEFLGFSARSTIKTFGDGLTGMNNIEKWNIALSLIVVLGNVIVCAFVSVSELPLALRRSRRAREAIKCECNANSILGAACAT
jgi:hypothetical protein